ncbi:MAG: IS256 family transposase, partial [Candidatus Zipacnadales bacterium]
MALISFVSTPIKEPGPFARLSRVQCKVAAALSGAICYDRAGDTIPKGESRRGRTLPDRRAHGQPTVDRVPESQRPGAAADGRADRAGPDGGRAVDRGAGRAALEAVLEVSAAQIAGPPHRGRSGGEVRRHGKQRGRVRLSTQKVRVTRPRLRHKCGGNGAEVAVPAYQAMQSDPSLGEKLCAILMSGVSTRNYERVVPQMAESCGVSKSAVSREFVQASAEQLKALCERRFDDVELLVIYLDGVRFGEHHVIVAVGVDSGGHKHVLGLAEGATENAPVVTRLLEELVERGVTPDQRRLFVIDGSKALRSAIDVVFGSGNLVQRCRKHKIDNVVGHLPRDLGAQVKSVMRAAYKLDA